MKTTSLFFALLLAPLGPVVRAAPAAAPKTKNARPQSNAWKPATGAQRVAVAASIRAQLEAFKRDDWAKAATYQSEGLRRNFGTIERFRTAIERGYPQFARYKSIRFEAARARGDQVEIQARLTGQDGVTLRAIYLMKKEKGLYRVEGVQGGQVQPPAPREFDPAQSV